MNIKVLLLLGLVAIVAGDQRPVLSYLEPDSTHSSHSHEYDSPKYSFEWSVSDEYYKNNYGHQETRDDDYTQGSYYVHLSDGRILKVVYFVNGDSGFIADVSYEGEARYSDESYERRDDDRYDNGDDDRYENGDDDRFENGDDDRHFPRPPTFYSR